MTYEEIWKAVDKLAKINGLTPSGLAKKAGLDPTTFNKSKRFRPDGKKRWPSLQSISKITNVCNITIEQFYHILDDNTALNASTSSNQSIPLTHFFQFNHNNICDLASNFVFPVINDSIYAVEINTSIQDDFYPYGSILIVSKTSEIKRGDKIIVTQNDNTNIIGKFINCTTSGIKMYDLMNHNTEISIKMNNITKIGKILWVSQ